MSAFEETRNNYRELMRVLDQLEPVERHRFWMEMLIGPAVMGLAIVWSFGWPGLIFCFGWMLRELGTSHR